MRLPTYFLNLHKRLIANGRAQEYFGVQADLVTYAKAMGNRFPVAAIGGKADVMGVIGPGQVAHGGTYTGYAVGAAAADATLEILETEPIIETMFQRGQQLLDGIHEILGRVVSLWELMKVGERRLNMLRAFNAREGVGAEADTVPPKLPVPLQGGASDGIAVTAEEAEAAKALYYEMAGTKAAARHGSNVCAKRPL